MRSGIKTAVILALTGFLISPVAGARELKKWEWYVRLSIESDGGALQDPGNVLGQLKDASSGADRYDLPELKATFSPYLSIVFYRPGWDLEVVDYTSDYHPLTRKKGDDWIFEVRSDNAWRDLTLNWEGQNANMKRMVLVDLATGEIVPAVVDGAVQDYRFNMDGQTVRAFQWVSLSKKDYCSERKKKDRKNKDRGGDNKNDGENKDHSGRNKKSRENKNRGCRNNEDGENNNATNEPLQLATSYAVSDWRPTGWAAAEGASAGEVLPPGPSQD